MGRSLRGPAVPPTLTAVPQRSVNKRDSVVEAARLTCASNKACTDIHIILLIFNSSNFTSKNKNYDSILLFHDNLNIFFFQISKLTLIFTSFLASNIIIILIN